MSKEHIFGDWLARLFPNGGYRCESIFEGAPTDSINDHTKYRTDEKISGRVHTKQSRNFCVTCNTGWMKQVLEAARPIATKLIKGEPVVLTLAEQGSLATWIALTAVTADTKLSGPHEISDQDRLYMLRYKNVPPHWFVSIGTYVGPTQDDVASDFFYAKVQSEGRADLFVRSVATTYARLFTFVAIPPPPVSHAVNMRLALLNGQYLEPIWPPLFLPSISMPLAPPRVIGGRLRAGDGGLAREISASYVKLASAIHI